MYIHPTRGREKLRQPFRSWREGAHDDRSTAHADRNKAITVSILMQRVGVWINGGRWRGIVSTPSLVWWFQREVGHEILERSKRRPFSAESKQVPRWKNVLATNEGLSLSREGLCRGSWWTGVCPGQPSSLSAVLLSRPLSSDHARNTRCCPLLLSLSFGYRQSSPLLSHANNLSSRLERIHHFLTRRIFNELYKMKKTFVEKIIYLYPRGILQFLNTNDRRVF